jgi:hypothetical protein
MITMCCQVEVSATGRFPVQRNPTMCVCLYVYVCVCVLASVYVSLSVIKGSNNLYTYHR